jgi:uncharacterized protein
MNTKSCHVMAKPSGSVCNIDCSYCFYLEKDRLYPERNKNWRMDDDTLERFVKQHIDAQPTSHVDFAWQGGEPTLLGISFYQKVVELCDKYGEGKQIYHAFQTNGILLDDDWCMFLKQHNFLVGLSIDGPAHLHDHYRVNRSGKPTHAKVMLAIECLKKHGVEFNTLTVVTAKNVNHPLQVYEFLKQIGSTFIQFIPLVERHSQPENTDIYTLASPDETSVAMTDWSVSPKAYGKFLNTIFDHWIRNDVGRVFVQTFDTTLASWVGEPAGVCVFSETCGHAFALEANGDLYQCDHYVYPEYKLGNIHQISIGEMNNSDAAKQFGMDKKETLTNQCQSCEYKFACHGGCPKHRFVTSKQGHPNHNYLCEGYYEYFKHTEKNMKMMAELLRHGQAPASIMNYLTIERSNSIQQAVNEGVGRNDPCPCGSGKKFKKCCAQ